MLPWLTRRPPLLILFFVVMAMVPSVFAQEPAREVPHRVAVVALADTEPPAEPEALPAGEIRRRIDAYLQPLVDAGQLSGNLLVARGDEVVYERSFGMADFELQVPNTPQTRFNVASITKPMTVIVLIQLILEEKLSMTDKLSKWIPDFPRGGEITVEHLARHRAGIPHRVTEQHEQTVPRSAAEMARLAARHELTFAPGSQSSYSSGGFSVLARVLELAGGASYTDLLEKYVFEPAGMSRSIHTDSRVLLPGRASAYLPDARGGIANAPLEDLSYLVGAGSVYSTARDLRDMLDAVRKGVYGEGPQASNVDDTGIDWNGRTSGYRAFADWHKASDVTVVLTSNLQTGAGDQIRRDVHRIAAGEEVPPPAVPRYKAVDVPVETLQAYEGTYQLRPGSELRVQVVDGTLTVNAWTLVPTGERQFFSPQDYAAVEVVLDEAGKPQRLDWKIGDNTYPCPRIGDL